MNEPMHPELLLAHREFLRSLARSLVRDEHRAEDVVQQTWLAALERPPRSATSLRSWLSSVARHAAYNMTRGERRRRQRERLASRPEPPESAEAIVCRLAVQQQLVKAVLTLDEPMRTAILLRFYEDLTPTKIAQRLGEPLETIRSRLRRGLHRLRRELDPGEEAERRAWAFGLLALAERPRGSVGMVVAKSIVKGLAVMDVKLKLGMGVVGAGALWLAFFGFDGGFSSRLAAPRSGSAESSAPLSQPKPEPARARRVVTSTTPTEPDAAPDPELPVAEAGTLIVQLDAVGPMRVGGVVVTIFPHSAGALLESRERMTDAAGEARFEDLQPTHYDLMVDRGVEAVAEVRAGEERVVTLTLPAGLAVTGVVIDAEGVAVAGADLWLSEARTSRSGGPGSRRVARSLRWKWTEGAAVQYRMSDQPGAPVVMQVQPDPGPSLLRGAIVGQSAEDGTFRIEGVAEGRLIGARAPLWEPSPLAVVERARGDAAAPLQLVLPRRGGAVAGVVRDSTGDPIAGATVQVGDEHGLVGTRTARGDVPGARPSLLRTDAEGRFLASGVAPERTMVAARAPGWAPAHIWVEVAPGQTATVELQLGIGAVVEGSVISEDGRPVGGVKVEAIGFESAYVESDEQGRYRLEGLADGRARLIADGGPSGVASSELSLRAGKAIHFDLHLRRGRVVTGIVATSEGEPLVEWDVSTERFGGPATVATGAEGRFEIVNVPEAADEVRAKPAGNRTPWSFATVTELPPGSCEVRIVVDSDEAPSAFVVGRLESASGGFEKDVPVRFHEIAARDAVTYLWSAEAETGAFRFGPLKPGRYLFLVDSAELGTVHLGDVELATGVTVDLGVTRIEEPGRLIVGVDETGDVLTLEVLKDGRRMHSGFPVGEPIALQPGRYVLRSGGERTATSEQAFEIRTGEETRVSVPLRAGVRFLLHVRDPGVGAPPKSVELTVRDAHGVVELTGELPRHAQAQPIQWNVTLSPGRHHVLVTTAIGLRGEVWIDVDEGGEPGKEIVIEL